MTNDNKTIADALKELEAKTADKGEIVPLLKQIERNTAKGVATSVGVAVGKALAKVSIKQEKRQKISPANKQQQRASTAIVASSKAPKPPRSSTARERAAVNLPGIPATANRKGQQTSTATAKTRDVAGRFAGKSAVDKQQEKDQNDKLISILKDAVASKKDTIKNTAGKLAFGPFWDIGKELQEAAEAMKDNAKDEKSTAGRLKKWGKGKLGVKDKPAAATGTAQMSGGGSGGGPGVLERVQQYKDLKDMWKNRKGARVRPPAGGGGMMARGAGVMRSGAGMLGSIGKMAGPLLSGISLPLVAAAGAAAFGIQQMTKALVTGESDINNWFKKITGLDAGKETQRDRDKSAAKDQQNLDQLNKDRAARGLSEVDSKGQYKTKGDVVFANGNTTTVKNADGSLTEQKGTRAARNNNAGNIEYGDFAKSQGAVGSDGRFAVFPNKAAGDKAKEKLFFEGKNYKDKTLAEATARWAPSNENDTAKYTQVLTKAAGGENKKMSEYTPEQRKAIMAAMEKHEGNKLTSTRTIPASEAEAYLASKGKGATSPNQTTAGQKKPDETTKLEAKIDPAKEQAVTKPEAKLVPAKEKTSTGQKASAAGTATSEVVAKEPEKKAEAAPPPVAPPAQQKQAEKATAAAVGEAVVKAAPAATVQTPAQQPVNPEASARQLTADVKSVNEENAKAVTDAKAAKAAKDSKYQDITDRWMKESDAVEADKSLSEPDKEKKLNELYQKSQSERDAYDKSVAAPAATPGTAQQQGQSAAVTTAAAPALSKREQEVQKIAAEQAGKPTYGDKDRAIQDKRSAAIEKIQADTTLTDDQKKQKKAEARDVAAAETKALKEEDSANNKKINERLAAADKADQNAKAVAVATETAKEAEKPKEEAAASGTTVKTGDAVATSTTSAAEDAAQGTSGATVPAVSATQPPLPTPQPAQAPPPQPVEVPGIEKLAKASEQQTAQQKDGGGSSGGIPNIKTDFDDTMLVLMSYDRI